MGASVASSSTPLFGQAGGNLDAPAILERNGWRLQVTPSGEMVSFTDGNLELINRRPGDNRPRLWSEGMRQYLCERPSVARREGATLVFQYDFSGQDNFSVHYELELQDLAPGMVTLKQKVGIQAAPKIDATVELTLPQNLQLPFENRKVFLPLKNGIGRRKPIQGFESENEYVYPMAGGTSRWGSRNCWRFPWWMNTRTNRPALDPLYGPVFRLLLFSRARRKDGELQLHLSGASGGGKGRAGGLHRPAPRG